MTMDFEEVQEVIEDLEDTRDTLIKNNPIDWIINDLNNVINKLKDKQ
jgi:hypothetical protein